MSISSLSVRVTNSCAVGLTVIDLKDVHHMIIVLQVLLATPDDDPGKLDEVRKFSAIYGRFDCKRKPEKPLTLHEVRTS